MEELNQKVNMQTTYTAKSETWQINDTYKEEKDE